MGAAIIPALSIAGTVLSAGLGVVSSIQQGNAQSTAAKYQASIAQRNQLLAERAAVDAERRGAIEEQNARRAYRALQGRQRVALAGSGILLDEAGTALDIQADTAQFGELDALTIRNNAQREAYGYRTQGLDFASQAQLLRAQSRNARTAGLYGAAGSLLGGAGSVAQKWYDFDQSGAFNSSASNIYRSADRGP